MAPSVRVKRSGGSPAASSAALTQPREPSSASKAAATTRVGSTNGIVVSARNSVLPANR